MNCADFETIVNELAESRPMDATARVNGLAHATICAECAARLHEAKSVGAGLHMAIAAETEAAPARVRESLLAAFAEHHNAAVAPAAPVSINKGASWRTVRWWGAAAVAAAAVLLLALLLPSLVRLRSPAPPIEIAGGQTPPPKPAATRPVDNSTIKTPTNPTTVGPERKSATANNNLALPRRKSTPARTPRPSSNQIESETVAKNSSAQYFPLTYLASATAMDSGTVVRIQVSRAKLISLGLPMNGERADELVKADLVLGDDGVARAIRLVE
jgi:hypothetical protein